MTNNTSQTQSIDASYVDDDSSLSTHNSDADFSSSRPVAFANGMIIKAVDDTVLLQQAAESLQSSLDMINAARDTNQPWKDARDVLDATAAALDDAGLALRKSGASEDGSRTSISSTPENNEEQQVRYLADKVIDKRRSLLGDVLLHDADGPWAKMVYGDGDGLSFRDKELSCIPYQQKEDSALIVWASQTGTAKRFAALLKKDLGKGKCVSKNMKKVTLEDLLKRKRIYFVCSTFGCGRPPRDSEVFYSLLQLAASQHEDNLDDLSESEREKPLSGVSVAIAALGSSRFKDFAAFGFGLSRELQALGASMVMDVTTIDAKYGKVKQKEAFQVWNDKVVNMEKERLESAAESTTKESAKAQVASPSNQKEMQTVAKTSCCTIL